MTDKTKTVPKRKGRPPKKAIAAKKEGNRKAVGRPKGDADAIREYKARLLASPKSRKVMDSILNAALDDDHKNQAAAWKLVVDRIMPLSYFDEAKGATGKAAVNITITGVGGETTIIGEQDDDIDGEYTNLNVTAQDE
tara:strand:+ start:3021 stop:3434 length:414 start_codon:yes stop_codon:yes gene_type:complete